jgi:GNAT superfamily N-acetyltransferase
MARYDVNPATNLADIAFVVRDAWQGRGVGSLLMARMREIAASRGLEGFTADVLNTNRAMIAVFQKSGLHLQMEMADGVYHLVALFDPKRRARRSRGPGRPKRSGNAPGS